MDNLVLNIQEYSTQDLIHMFDLQNEYTNKQVVDKYSHLCNVLDNSSLFSSEKNKDLKQFFHSVKEFLIQQNRHIEPSSIQTNIINMTSGFIPKPTTPTSIPLPIDETKQEKGVFLPVDMTLKENDETLATKHKQEMLIQQKKAQDEKNKKMMEELETANAQDPDKLQYLISDQLRTITSELPDEFKLMNENDISNNHRINFIAPRKVDKIKDGDIILKEKDDELYYKSELNQFGKKTNSYVLNFDSKFRKDYYKTPSSSFTVNLTYTLKNVISMELKSIELPTSWHMFDEIRQTNVFYIYQELDGSLNRYRIHIDEGNYDITDFMTFVTYSRIENDGTYTTISVGDFPFLISINANSGRTTIEARNNEPFTLDFNIEGRESYFNLGWILGYRLKRYEGSMKYTSEGLFNSGMPKYVYFIVKDFQNHKNEKNVAIYEKSYLAKDIISKIPLYTNAFNVLYDDQKQISRKRQYLGPVNIHTLEVELVDEYGEIINLNFMDFSFSLEFECLYDF